METICPHCTATNRIAEEHITQSAKCGRCHEALFNGEVIEATTANFDKLIQDEQPVIVDFWATWCGPCQSFAPIFANTAQQRKNEMRFIKINTEQEQALAMRFNIRSIPTLMVFKQGKLLTTLNGAMPQKAFDQWLDSIKA